MIRWLGNSNGSVRPSDHRGPAPPDREPARWFRSDRSGSGRSERRRAEDSRVMRKRDRFLLWVDAVGGFWVCLGDEIVLGQPGLPEQVDVPILGDLSARHARIRRDGEGYLIEAIREVYIDGRRVADFAPLADGNLVELGEKVKFTFCRPHALSATARLDFVSRHRTQPSTDAVILLADTCILGPKPSSHIVCRRWTDEVALYRHESHLFCRGPGEIEIDGKKHGQKGPIEQDSRITGERFSLSLEQV
jgi:hypothetical protein